MSCQVTIPKFIGRGALVLTLMCQLVIPASANGERSLAAKPSCAPTRERLRLAGNELVLELSPSAATSAPEATPTPTPVPSVRRTSEQETNQGERYGQPGFIGDPTNLNVVNVDIRDVLNFFTQEYGVNFVIDKSVGAVPVTVNVTDVPWNIALDAILRANRLGIDVNGNLLRVAAIEVLASESALQRQVRDAQLDNAPLVTEFVRLNYARASGTLAQAAGSSGGFAGGSTNQSFSGGSGGDATGGSGEQGLLPIISRRLSRRGGIEVDGRSNTLIITDVQENINAIRQLITLLDQPEPQVEIETRIVVVSRDFSRELGVQLSAAINDPTGSTGIFNPNNPSSGFTPTNRINFPLLTLTTGVFGTARINATISAFEDKGQAKTIGTPRVTALNNRPAQIETGQQIPVTTAQGASGGAVVFTTTYVSVPLRLSVTPQITDAGTVILRVTAENNALSGVVNGIPGIATQRMQTEVLVPDGGTTVIGGVLNDNERERQNRVPGLSGIPIIGNLFKTRTTSRTTDEILFFITPRIYRPDFQGRPTNAPASNTTRTKTIPQPVPLGNPQSNTPTPNQLQQMPANNPAPNSPIAPQTPTVPGTQTTARPDATGGTRP
ncbi:MAG: type IV pilus secretin PilQ [Pyrinomonadaceae bacterium]|nr:type IV pilus secretin PilQ [Pyrinomonadaceae bacterium]